MDQPDHFSVLVKLPLYSPGSNAAPNLFTRLLPPLFSCFFTAKNVCACVCVCVCVRAHACVCVCMWARFFFHLLILFYMH